MHTRPQTHLPVVELDDGPDGELSCRHCRYALVELEQCRPITPTPGEWGAIPSWGSSSQIHDLDHPIATVGACVCGCHSAWRMLTGNRL